MSKKYADDKHQSQAEEFIMELGKFVLNFERVCDVMRHLIMFMLRSQGLKNQGVEQVIVGDKAAAELERLLGAIYNELPGQDEDDKKCVRKLLDDFQKVVQKRNILLHSSWNFSNKAADEEPYAATVRFRGKRNSGAGAEVHSYSAPFVRQRSSELERIQILLQRLQVCVNQGGFKVSTEFAKPM